MAEADGRERTLLRLPRVPFDLSGMVIGAAGWVAYVASWDVLAKLLSIPTIGNNPEVPAAAVLRMQFFGRIFEALKLPFQQHVGALAGYSGPMTVQVTRDLKPAGVQVMWTFPEAQLDWMQMLVVAAWMLMLWSVVGGALARVHALRIARDESLPVDEAFVFAFKNLRSLLLAPLFVAAAAAFFIACVMLVGLAASVPVAGTVLAAVLQPLALLGGLAVAFIVIGGVFGFPMLQAAVAAERNGFLDAVSRLFSYVFVRPLTFIVGCMVVMAAGVVLGAFGIWLINEVFLRLLVSGAQIAQDLESARAMALGGLQASRLDWPSTTTTDGETVPAAGMLWVTWFWGTLAFLAVKGAVLSYVVGGFTDVYFLLRGEVDGMPDGDVYVDGEEASFGEPLPGQPEPADAGSSSS